MPQNQVKLRSAFGQLRPFQSISNSSTRLVGLASENRISIGLPVIEFVYSAKDQACEISVHVRYLR